ncbi:MAG TPA: TonB-dependent receptor [Vicinamibacterales bacterium]|nr:TonB-dependent receptor [Vicinamibacterales bacterium]
MRRPDFFVACALAAASVLASPLPARAQLTTGTISGRIVDAQGAAIPGVTVEAADGETGFVRTDTTDTAGTYRLAALPAGKYEVKASLQGFEPFDRTPVDVNIATTTTIDVKLAVARVSERVTVTAPTPLISTSSSSLGEVVDINRVQGLPLNGRQFANLAATVPGVGLGFHSDVSKSAQYAPQISGGNGRNVNYIVDGGDNNDDTVGGLLQMFPLEAIQEFKLVTQRFDAEYGRSNGAVLNVVTKSGTNTLHGSWFTSGRDDALNARTFTEKQQQVAKQDYSRYQYGGSVGGPIRKDKIFFFGAYEGTNQHTVQSVNTQGIFADGSGVFPVEFREQMGTTKVTANLSNAQYLAVRYGFDHNTQPNGATPVNAHSTWVTSTNDFHSLNANHNWITGPASLNEFVFQYSRFVNDIPVDAPGPSILFASFLGGTNVTAPQRTEQVKWQFRDDYSRTTGGPGISHELHVGLNVINEPRLFISTESGKYGVYSLAGPDVNGGVASVFQAGGNLSFNQPLTMYGLYTQDDWRATPRLTLNLGVRWDYVAGLPIDQGKSSNFQRLQAAGQAGQLAGYPLLSDFGKSPRGDIDNVQPRFGAVYDLRGNGRDILRGGWGIYTDFAYTASNVLMAALDGLGGGGITYQSPFSPTGLLKEDGTLFRVTDPIDSIYYLNTVDPAKPVAGEVASPRLEQPYSRQTTAGWEHAVGGATSVSVDYARVEGRDLNMRVRPNVLVNGKLALADIGVQPPNNTFRVAISKGQSLYNAMIVGVRQRMSHHVDLDASYTLAKATSSIGTAYDEVAQNIIQNIADPFNAMENAPSTRTDARHRVTISAIVEAPLGIRVAPVVFYRSALPINTIDQQDPNLDGNRNDPTALAYKFVGVNADGTPRIEETGPCTVVNCSRRAPFSQVNMRVSRSFTLGAGVHLEAIAEVFNLFNAKNPSLPVSTFRTARSGALLSNFMMPSAYAGDVGQPEQRIGQLGVRLTF